MIRQNSADGKKNLLLVEDDRELASIYSTFLRKTFNVRTATSVKEASKYLDSSIEFAILDRLLPDGSGDEILSQIRDKQLDCRILMVTGVDPDIDLIDLEFDEYLVKPVTGKRLLATLHRLEQIETYTSELHRLSELSTELALMESSELHDGIGEDDDYLEVKSELMSVKKHLNSLISDLNYDHIKSIYTDIGVS